MSWHRNGIHVLLLCALTLSAARARAGGAADAPITVTPIEIEDRAVEETALGWLLDAEPGAAAERELDDAAFVTVVRVDERAGEAATVAEILAESMGVHVRSLGGPGSFSSLSVRGAAAGHTSVFIDGVPLSRVAGVSTDLGRFTLSSFSTIELYRGAVPVELGGAALGGALNLTTPVGLPSSGKRLTLGVGGGSFATRRVHARWLDGSGDRRHGYHLSIDYGGTRGDFEYFDDKGTNLDLDDDEYVTRQNNGHDQLDLTARYRGRRGDATLELGSRGQWRHQGIPGRGSVSASSATATTWSQMVDARLEARRLAGAPRLAGLISGFTSLEWQRFIDRDGNARLGVQDSRQWWLSTGAVARMTADMGPGHLLSAGVEGRFELAADRDELADGEAARSMGWRGGGALSLSDELTAGDGWLVLLPALRLDWLRTAPIAYRNQPVVDGALLAPRGDVFLSPRVAGRARVHRALALKASAGWYFREPTAPELFGGRGVHVGNPGLVPETGVSGDLGLVLAPARRVGPADRIHAEAALFARRPRDTIVYRTALGGAFNLGDALMAGVETSASLRLARAATVSASYAWVATRQDSPLPSYDGKPLPYAPRHQLHGRVDVARRLRGRALVMWADLAWTSGNYLDLAGAVPVPGRRLVGAGVKLEPVAELVLGVEAKNLTDARVEMVSYDPPPRPDLAAVPRAIADVYGYPLPGRAIYVTAQWRY